MSKKMRNTICFLLIVIFISACSSDCEKNFIKSSIDYNNELYKIRINSVQHGQIVYSDIYFNYKDNVENTIATETYKTTYKFNEKTGRLDDKIEEIKINLLSQFNIWSEREIFLDSLETNEINRLIKDSSLPVEVTNSVYQSLINYCDSLSLFLNENDYKFTHHFVNNLINPNLESKNFNDWNSKYFNDLPVITIVNNLDKLRTNLALCETEIVLRLKEYNNAP